MRKRTRTFMEGITPSLRSRRPAYRLVALLFVALLALLFHPLDNDAQGPAGETDNILAAAELHFTQLKAKQYPGIWQTLTAKTQENIMDSVIKASAKQGQRLTTEQVRNDFTVGGPLSKAYWDAYLTTFNPDMVLKESSWTMGKIKKDYAEVIIQHKKAERPAIIQMKKENGAWRVGLEETFGILRWLIK